MVKHLTAMLYFNSVSVYLHHHLSSNRRKKYRQYVLRTCELINKKMLCRTKWSISAAALLFRLNKHCKENWMLKRQQKRFIYLFIHHSFGKLTYTRIKQYIRIQNERKNKWIGVKWVPSIGCDRHCWSNSFWASSNAWQDIVLNPMTGVIVYLYSA